MDKASDNDNVSKDFCESQRNEHAGITIEWFELLQDILMRYEPAIRTRWMNWSKEKRIEMFQNLWSDMPAHHRPDIECSRFCTPGALTRAQKNGLQFPHINIEDLVKGKNLLLFLNSRGRNQPFRFIRADAEAGRLGNVLKLTKRIVFGGYTMVFHERTISTSYGELVACDAEGNGSRIGLTVPEGIRALGVQSWTYEFLVRVCGRILHDKTKADMIGDNIPIQPCPPADFFDDDSESRIERTIIQRPYRLPSELNIVQLKTFFAAKMSAAQDHLLAVREDPGYFEMRLSEGMAHRPEQILDSTGSKHPALAINALPELWGKVVCASIKDSICNLQASTLIYECLTDIERLQQKYAIELDLDTALPEEYLISILKLLKYLKHLQQGPISILKTAFLSAPPMRRFFQRYDPRATDFSKMNVQTKPNLAKDKPRDHLIWLVHSITEPSLRDHYGLDTLLDEAERLLGPESQVQDLFSPYVSSIFANVAAMSICEYELKHYEPWCASFDDEAVKNKGSLDALWRQDGAFFEKMRVFAPSAETIELGIPKKGRFNYPANKRRTKVNNEQMRRAEASQDSLWEAVCTDLDGGDALTPDLDQLLRKEKLERTPEWSDFLVPQKRKFADVIQSFEDLEFERRLRTESTIGQDKPDSSKVKQKTQGAPDPERQPAEEAQPAPEQIQIIYKVDQRALNVFQTIFYAPSVHADGGRITWLDFVHAMTAMRFAAKHDRGSEWNFTSLLDNTKLVIHDPHTKGKMKDDTARWYGRRLRRKYGWCSEMFELAERGAG